MRKRSSWLRRLALNAQVVWSIIGITLLLILLLEAGLSLVFWINDQVEGDPDWLKIEKNRAFADGYGQADWTQDYFIEFEESNFTDWHSYVYWRRKPYNGRYINIDDRGIRKTWHPDKSEEDAAAEPLKIFMFGGSALWGTGARDDYTIASHLARIFHHHNIAVRITNFGESGYVNTQEMIALHLEIQKGNLPDYVVFYDGVNDAFSAHSNRIAGIPQNEENRIREFNASKIGKASHNFFQAVLKKTSLNRLVQAVMRRISKEPGAAADKENEGDAALSDQEMAKAVMSRYEENLKIIRTLGREINFKTFFYWQPIIFEKEHLTPYEADVVGDGKAIEQLYAETCRLAAESDYLNGFQDLSGIFKQTKDPVFIDWCHITEDGNQIVAERIGADILAACRADKAQ